jgi:hypothetical protein
MALACVLASAGSLPIHCGYSEASLTKGDGLRGDKPLRGQVLFLPERFGGVGQAQAFASR